MFRLVVFASSTFVLLASCSSDDAGDTAASSSSSSSTATASTTSDGTSTSSSSTSTGGDTTGATESTTTGATDTATATTGGSTSGTGTAGVQCPELDDDFEDPQTLDCWTLLNGPSASASIENGQMVLEASPTTQWSDDEEAGLLYKAITGDFMLETQVRVHDGSEEIGTATNRLGGLMARDPDDAAGENHVAWLVGHGDAQGYTFLFQSTVDGVSDVGGLGSPGVAFLPLRLCRVGNDMVLVRMTGVGWAEWSTYSRPNLADTLQVGMTAFSFNSTPELVAEFEAATFTVPTAVEDCTAP